MRHALSYIFCSCILYKIEVKLSIIYYYINFGTTEISLSIYFKSVSCNIICPYWTTSRLHNIDIPYLYKMKKFTFILWRFCLRMTTSFWPPRPTSAKPDRQSLQDERHQPTWCRYFISNKEKLSFSRPFMLTSKSWTFRCMINITLNVRNPGCIKNLLLTT